MEITKESLKLFCKKYWWMFLLSLIIILLIISLLMMFVIHPKEKDSKRNSNVSKISGGSGDNNQPSTNIDPDNPPKFIQADFVELNKVYLISKFRSGNGHDFSQGSEETCRSMKHYFSTMDPNQPDYKKISNGDKTANPMPTIEKDAKIFSPVDGTLRVVNYSGVQFDQELEVTPDAYPSIRVRMMHVQLAPGIVAGKVMAGQLIGLVLANQSFDMAIDANIKTSNGKYLTGYISYFAAMPDNIFTKYQARGIVSRDQLITTKEYRDAHPFQCGGNEAFNENYSNIDPAGNLVYLSGYDEMQKLVNKW